MFERCLCFSVGLKNNCLVSDKLKASLKSNNSKVDQGNLFCLEKMSLVMSSVGI